MQLIEITGLAAGACTSAASFPQIANTIRQKKASQVSPWMFIVLLAGNILWTFYGIVKADVPIIITNSLSVCADLIMLVLRFKYRNK